MEKLTPEEWDLLFVALGQAAGMDPSIHQSLLTLLEKLRRYRETQT